MGDTKTEEKRKESSRMKRPAKRGETERKAGSKGAVKSVRNSVEKADPAFVSVEDKVGKNEKNARMPRPHKSIGEGRGKKSGIRNIDRDEALVGHIAQCMRNKKGIRVVSLDMRQVVGATFGFFVICEATSGPQVRAIADEISDKVYERFKEDPLHMEGYANGEWVLLDYGNILAHVFLDSARQHYRLEDLWGDAVLKVYKDEE